MSSNSLVFHTSGGISSSPAAFLSLFFCTESSSSCVNLLYSHIQLHNTCTNICRNIVNNNDNFNGRTNTLLYKNISLTLYSRKGDVSCVWEVSWRRGQTATYWPKVLLTITALLLNSGCAAQAWITEGPSPLCGAGSHSAGILSPTNSSRLSPGYIFVWRPPASNYLHRCISWLAAQSRVNM